MAAYTIKQGDTAPPLRATLSDKQGIVGLDGAVVRFVMRQRVGTKKVQRVIPDADVVADKGEVTMRWLTADTSVAGVFDAEFTVTFGDGTIETFPSDGWIEVEIKPNAA